MYCASCESCSIRQLQNISQMICLITMKSSWKNICRHITDKSRKRIIGLCFSTSNKADMLMVLDLLISVYPRFCWYLTVDFLAYHWLNVFKSQLVRSLVGGFTLWVPCEFSIYPPWFPSLSLLRPPPR